MFLFEILILEIKVIVNYIYSETVFTEQHMRNSLSLFKIDSGTGALR